MVTVSKNLSTRIKLLKADIDRLKTCKDNNRPLQAIEYIDINRQLKICKELLSKELRSKSINDLIDNI